jgi:diguanylate cyclase (GGDEF)-like protein/PAS domain S-box-containing protein
MKKIAKNLNILFLISLLLVIILFSSEYLDTKEVIEKEVQDNLLLRSNVMTTEINEWINRRSIVIDSIGDYFENYSLSNEEKLSYLKFQLEKNEMFNSIYYGDENNKMINASGWQPPSDFDLRERPWYITAIKQEALVVTDVFLNASEDDLIITIAKSVRNSEDENLAVIAGDISLKELFDLVLVEQSSKRTDTYLIDGNHTLLLKEYNEIIGIEDMPISYEGFFNEDMIKDQALNSIELLKLNGEDFYAIKRSIDSLNWSIITLIPYREINQPMRQLLLTFITIVFILISLLIIIFLVIRRFIIRPLEELENDVINVKIIPDEKEEISTKGKFGFKILINKINELLNKINDYSKRVEFQKNKYQSLFRNSNDAMVLIDTKEKVVDINEEFNNLFGYTLEEIKGKDIDDLIVLPEELSLSRSYNDKMKTGEKVNREAKRVHKSGELINVEINAVPIFVKGKYIGGFGIYRDIRERKANEDRIKFLSFYDELTELYNRRFYEIELNRLDNNRRLPLSLVIADVNGLKLVNDAFGHKQGDEVLIKTAKILKESSRTDDIVARLGGDEFVLLLPNTTSDEAEKIVNRIDKKISQVKIGPVELSVSLGWETKTSSDESIEKIFKNAENYMYRKKLNESPSVHGKVIQTIIHSLHEKNSREEEHSHRVSLICEAIGQALDLDQRYITDLKVVGLLHDIGKIAINEHILSKPGKLTPSEYDEIKRHSEIGYRILSASNNLSDLADAVLHHHERWDGLGYPKGISGKDIPLMARIITVADAFDAMISERSYRDAMTVDEGLEELEKNAGSQFDPAIVKIFIEEEIYKKI